MKIAFRRLFNPKVVHNLRSLYTSQIAREDAYPGKTIVNILNQTETSVLMIDNHSPTGFLLNNGLQMIGPMIIFPRSLLFWNVGSARDINKDSLILFNILEPPIDLLILGLEKNYDYKFILSLKEILKNLGIRNEIYPVDQACTAFNFISNDGRYAAAALIPPVKTLPKVLTPFQRHLKNVNEEEDSDKLIDSK